MAKRKKNGFDISALTKYAEQLDALGGSDALKRAAQAGMIEAKQEINRQVTTAMQPGNLPAGGKYSTGDTLQSLSKDLRVNWQGNIGELGVGFDMSQSGITSIMLLHGTPKMRPVAGLQDALTGKKGRAAARKAQEAAMRKVLERLGK